MQESVDRGGHSVWLVDVWDVARILDNDELGAHPFGEVAAFVPHANSAGTSSAASAARPFFGCQALAIVVRNSWNAWSVRALSPVLRAVSHDLRTP